MLPQVFSEFQGIRGWKQLSEIQESWKFHASRNTSLERLGDVARATPDWRKTLWDGELSPVENISLMINKEWSKKVNAWAN